MLHNEFANAAIDAAKAGTAVPRRRRSARIAKQTEPGTSQQGPGAPPANQLHSFDALPDYLRDNEFIITGYRHTLPVRDSLKSLFNLHNETGNIWSHFIGFILFVVLTIWMVNSPPTPAILARPHFEQLWQAVSRNLPELKGSVGENLIPRALQDSWQSGVHTLHEWEKGLQERVHGIQETVSESVHTLQESVHSIQDQVQSGAKAIAGQLHHGLAALVHEGLAAGDAVRSVAVNFPSKELLAALAGGLHWPTPRWPMYVFCAGAMSCLFLSAFCHLLGCCQKHIATFIWRLDYTGIALLIVTSFYPSVYYGFFCQPYTSAVYLTGITVLGAAAVAMSLLEVFQQTHWRSTRAALYVGLGCMGVVPLGHMLILHGDVWHVRTFVLRDLFMGISYIAGAAIYAQRVPERWFPGKFDMVFHSHQIFHLCVVLGAYLHWRASLLLLEWRDASGGCAVPVVRGPINQVMAELALHGHDIMHIDQVWEGLRLAAAEHLGLSTAGHAGAHQ